MESEELDRDKRQELEELDEEVDRLLVVGVELAVGSGTDFVPGSDVGSVEHSGTGSVESVEDSGTGSVESVEDSGTGSADSVEDSETDSAESEVGDVVAELVAWNIDPDSVAPAPVVGATVPVSTAADVASLEASDPAATSLPSSSDALSAPIALSNLDLPGDNNSEQLQTLLGFWSS